MTTFTPTTKRKLDLSKAVTIVAALQELTLARQIEHDRLKHALDLMLAGEAYYSHTAESWICASASVPNKIYAVDLEREMCSCADFTHRGTYCKHLIACSLQARVTELLGAAHSYRERPETLDFLVQVAVS